MPYEGVIELNPPGRDSGNEIFAPTGDLTHIAGPYDPDTGLLYLTGWDGSGWVEVYPIAGTWLFGERGKIRPRLSGSSVPLVRSDTLGLQFYIGFSKPHWLTGRSGFRVFSIKGTKVSRVMDLEREGLRYLGDDVDAGMAVFGRPGAVPLDRTHLVWFDGARVVKPNADQRVPDTFCNRR